MSLATPCGWPVPAYSGNPTVFVVRGISSQAIHPLVVYNPPGFSLNLRGSAMEDFVVRQSIKREEGGKHLLKRTFSKNTW